MPRLALAAGFIAIIAIGVFGIPALLRQSSPVTSGPTNSIAPTSANAPAAPGVVVAPSPSATPLLGTLPCQSAAGFVSDLAASTGPVPSASPSGGASTLLVKLSTVDGLFELAEFDPAQADATPNRLVGMVAPGSELVPSPDGRAIAIEVDRGPVFPCAEPVVVSRAGDWYTVPFDVNRVGVVQHLAWSRDGGILYGIHQSANTTDPTSTLPVDPGSVWAWDARADTVERLGSPCTGCALGDPTIGPDGTLAVAFLGEACSDTAWDHTRLECVGSGVAVLGKGGWRTVTTGAQMLAAAPNSLALSLLGWSGSSTLVLGSPTTGVTRLGLDGTLTRVGFGTVCCGNGLNDWLSLSPDGTTTAVGLRDGDLVHSEILLTPVDGSHARSIGKVVSSVRNQDGSSTGGRLGQAAWSPDSQTIAVGLWRLPNGDSPSTSVLVVGRDGSGLRQFALPIAGDPYPTGPAPLAWLPPVR